VVPGERVQAYEACCNFDCGELMRAAHKADMINARSGRWNLLHGVGLSACLFNDINYVRLRFPDLVVTLHAACATS
jgi:hypothetical protein